MFNNIINLTTKQLTVILLYVLFSTTTFFAETVTASSYAGGDGTVESPYQISNLAELRRISETSADWGKHFIVTADINATDTSTWNGGKGFSPIGNKTTNFTGSFDGQKFILSNLRFDRPRTTSTGNYTGLFGYCNGAIVKNTGVTSPYVAGHYYVGGLIGYAHLTTVTNCFTNGTILAYNYAGGLIGSVDSLSEISNCYSSATTNCWLYNGGLVGYLDLNATISNCYSTSTVNDGGLGCGGLVGHVYRTSVINNCYATGLVNEGTTGGVVGTVYQSSTTVSQCYWDRETTLQSISAQSSPDNALTTTEFNAFDFSSIWSFGTDDSNPWQDLGDNSRPHLYWQEPLLGLIGNKSIGESILLTFTATATDGDSKNDSLTYNLSGTVPNGVAIDSSSGVFTWTPTGAQVGDHTFTIQVTDGTYSDSEEITVTVSETLNLNNGLVFASHLDNGQALDWSGNGNDGIVTDVIATSDKNGETNQALHFDGVTSKLVIPAVEIRTISMDIKRTANGDSSIYWEMLWSNLSAVEYVTAESYQSCLYNHQTQVIRIRHKNGSVQNYRDIPYILNLNQWYTLTVTDDGSEMKLYVNGIFVEWLSHSGDFNADNIRIMSDNRHDYEHPCIVDEIRIYDRALSAHEVYQLYIGYDTESESVDTLANGLEFGSHFDNGTATDYTGNGNNGTVNGATSAQDLGESSGASLSFDGIDDKVRVVNLPVSTYSAITLNCWFKADQYDTIRMIMSVQHHGIEDIRIWVDSSSLYWAVDDGTRYLHSESFTDTEEWHMISLTFDGNTMRSYLDGVLLDSKVASFDFSSASGIINIGGREFDSYYFDGKLDEPLIYSRALTNGEIEELYSRGAAKPVLSPIGNKSVDELVELTFNAEATDADLPANTLIYSLEGTVPTGASIGSSDGVFKWIPTESQDGEYTFTVKVSDGTLSDTEEFTVTVNEVNDAPVLAEIGNKSVDELVELTFTASATDSDLPANTLTYSLEGAVPTGATIGTSSGIFTWNPTESQDGKHTFTIKVSDGLLSDSEKITVTVNEVNKEAPVLALIGDKEIDEELPLSFMVNATDYDLPLTLIYNLENAPTGASIDSATGAFSWTPTELQDGSHTFTIKVSDGELTNSEEITVTVNEVNVAPVLDDIVNRVVNELKTISFSAYAMDRDIPINMLTYSLINAPLGASIHPRSGVFFWVPGEDQDGIHSFRIAVSDGYVVDTEEVTITVNEVNEAPTLTEIGNKSSDEEVEFSFTVTASDSDIPVTSLSFSLVNAPVGATMDSETGEFMWTPTESQDGEHTFTVQVSDGELTTNEEITVSVIDVNESPEVDKINQDLSLAVRTDRLYQFRTVTIQDKDITGEVLEQVTVLLSLDNTEGELFVRPSSIETYNINSGLWRVTGTVAEVNDALEATMFFSYTTEPQLILITVAIMDGREDDVEILSGSIRLNIENKVLGDSALNDNSEEGLTQLENELIDAGITDIKSELLKDYQTEINKHKEHIEHGDSLQRIIDAVNTDLDIMFYDMNYGWNLIHVPSLEPMDCSVFFTRQSGLSWRWDRSNYFYEAANYAIHGEGRWVYWNGESECRSVTGVFTDTTRSSTNLEVGWNLIGTLDPLTLDTDRIIVIWIWDSENSYYVSVTQEEIKDNAGYWIFCNR